jgi:hypothetical protein
MKIRRISSMAVWRLGLVFMLSFPAGCSPQPQSDMPSWSHPVRFSYFFEGAPLTIYDRPGDTLAPGRVVDPGDEGNGTYGIDIIAIAGEFARITMHGDTGWIRQAVLRHVPLHRGVIMDGNGTETGSIPLPDFTSGIRVSVRDSFLVIDNDAFVLRANLKTGCYDDYMVGSSYTNVSSVVSGLGFTATATQTAGDTVWGYDPYRSLVFAVDPGDTIIIDSIRVQGLPENAVVSGIARIENAVYLWGLEYEFEACPLFQIPLTQGQGAAPLLQLSDEGGLLTRIGGEEFLFFERTGNTYRYDSQTGKLAQVQKPPINPAPYREIIYAASIDRYIGILLSVYE